MLAYTYVTVDHAVLCELAKRSRSADKHHDRVHAERLVAGVFVCGGPELEVEGGAVMGDRDVDVPHETALGGTITAHVNARLGFNLSMVVCVGPDRASLTFM